jgi:hypothetical protein
MSGSTGSSAASPQRVVADRHPQPLGEGGHRRTRQCQPEMLNDMLQPRCLPGLLSDEVIRVREGSNIA